MTSPRRRLASLALAGALSSTLVLAACGSDEEKTEEPATTEQPNQQPADPETWPLTGLPVADGEDAEQKHPVLVVKMDNTPSSAPQVGLGAADLVVEELVEGGVTRLAAMYYSEIPDDIGPVRSMRASDIGIVEPVDGDMVTSGAASQTIERIKDAGITFFNEEAAGFYRATDRSAPYNLFTNLADVAKEAKEKTPVRPADYLPWSAEDAKPVQGKPAKSLTASFSGGHTTEWVYRGGSYQNVNSNAEKADRFDADNVLVLRVEVGDAGYLDPAGNPVPESKFVGKGEAMLFTDGKVVRGTWDKKKLDSPLNLKTKSGDLTVPPGKTWIELVPAEGGNVTIP